MKDGRGRKKSTAGRVIGKPAMLNENPTRRLGTPNPATRSWTCVRVNNKDQPRRINPHK